MGNVWDGPLGNLEVGGKIKECTVGSTSTSCANGFEGFINVVAALSNCAEPSGGCSTCSGYTSRDYEALNEECSHAPGWTTNIFIRRRRTSSSFLSKCEGRCGSTSTSSSI